MNRNTLSVIIPNYNHGHYIGEALEAILDQSFRPLEVIVIDDASTDNSIEVIEQLARKDSTIRLLRNEKNMGPMPTVNRGLKQANGNCVYMMAADDKILPSFLEKSMNLLAQYPQAGLCSADMILIDERGVKLSEYRATALDRALFLSPQEVLRELRKNPNYIIGGTTIFRREALEEVGGFLPELMGLCDWFAERAIALKYGACFIPETLFLWRQTSANYSNTAFKDTRRMLEVMVETAKLMRSPQYREIFPRDFIKFWSRWFGEQVMDAAWGRLAQHRQALLAELRNCLESSNSIDRLFLWTISLSTRAALLFCRLYLKKLRLRSALREIERTN
jgi:glycosyltransferase involved in cell wall biosynthesis